MTDGFFPGFGLGIIATAFLVFIGMTMASDQTDSGVTAVGYRQGGVKRIRVGNHLWVSDLVYDVTPSNVVITVKYAPKNEVDK